MIINRENIDSTVILTITDIGSNHQALLMPNQDACGYRIDGEEFVLAVSDGVGSCKHADVGAKRCVEICINIFNEIKRNEIAFNNETIKKHLIENWRKSFQENANDYCATLKTVFKISNRIIALSIGDGLLAATSNGVAITSPVNITDFINETECMCLETDSKDIWSGTLSVEQHQSYAVICCTDGVANSLVNDSQVDLTRSIENEIPLSDIENEIVDLVREISKYSFDDKTIGVVKHEV